MATFGDSPTLKIVVIHHVIYENQSSRGIRILGIAETAEKPHGMLESRETIDNKILIVARGESITILNAEALRMHLASLGDHLSANGPVDLSRFLAALRPAMIVRRVPPATVHRTLGVTIAAAGTTIQAHLFTTKHLIRRLRQKSLR